jgi:uncharacterized protein (TIGR00730 family)
VAHTGLTELLIVDTMHERKARMASLADGFVALPGGLGTLEEFFETWTWAQLGVHNSPVALLDVDGFWLPLVSLIDHVEKEGFLRGFARDYVIVDDDAERLLDRMAAFRPLPTRKWIRAGET